MFTPKPLDMFRRREIDVYLIKAETEVDLGRVTFGLAVIVKFCLYIMRNCDQSPANFQFSKFKLQSLDIPILLGAEGPQQGPQGPKGPEGPPALRRS